MKSYLKIAVFCAFGLVMNVQSFATTIVESSVNKEGSNSVIEQSTIGTVEQMDENITALQPVLVGECCGTCSVSVNLLIFSFSYSWCCNPCKPIEEVDLPAEEV